MFSNKIELDLKTFKTQLCPNQSLYHNLKQCVYYHTSQDVRRVCEYTSNKCEEIDCQDQKCKYAHNLTEQMYHPERFKTRYCSFYPNNLDDCQFGSYCSFIHHDIEFKIELLHKMDQNQDFFLFHYKTVFCPFNFQHNRKNCVYAHNQQDFRRQILNQGEMRYKEIDCKLWKKYQSINSYDEGGCPEMQMCKFSHGWKEYDYHLNVYKTRKCNQKNCQLENLCPFYHNQKDKRQVPKNKKLQQTKIFNTIKSINESFSTDCQDSYCSFEDECDIKRKITRNFDLLYENQILDYCMIQNLEYIDSLKILDQIIRENEIKISQLDISILNI